MKIKNSPLWLIVEQVVPWLVLAILLTYSYAKFFRHSYGLRIDPSTGIVMAVFDEQPEPTLQVDDRILQIGSLRWEDLQNDLSKSLFAGHEPGDTVPIIVERNGQPIHISWKYPFFNQAEFFDQLNSEWWIAYAFWLAGLLTILLVRPKDTSWLLMALFGFLTAIWLIAGSGLSAYHIWFSAIVLRVAIWLCVPVYLHLHWVFPRPLRKLPSLLVVIVYGVAICFALAEGFGLLPGELYSLAFLIAIAGSLVLLIIHAWRQPSVRRNFRLPFIVLVLAVAPAVIWQTVDNLMGISPTYGSVGVLSLALLPFAYLYTAFRRRLGERELRVNRFFSISLFVVLLGTIGLPSVGLFDQLFEFPDKVLTFAFASAVLTAAAFIWVYPAFENLVEQRIFGIPLPSKRVLETYSTRITTSDSSSALVAVLLEEILPSLLIRQFAFLQLDQGTLKVLSTMGLSKEQMPKEPDVPYLMTQTGVYRSPDISSRDLPFSWARLILPLKLGDRLLGFWLFGRRDPDDIFSQLEIPVLSSLANLTAIALSNILQTEHLKSMHEANIIRDEEERHRLSRDLHDSILNEMAALLMREDAPLFSPAFQKAFETLTERLREIVSDLRPSALNLGLKLAFEDLADNLTERNQEGVEVVADIQTDGEWRYPDDVENHLYRIVQEACRNALKYAHAKTITIFGRLHQNEIDVRVEDDGVGLGSEDNLKLDQMLAKRHFGLVGMLERANLIGSEISIRSTPHQGTKIQLTWKSKEDI